MAGHSIGAALIPRWNIRTETPKNRPQTGGGNSQGAKASGSGAAVWGQKLGMEVVEEHPHFNAFGQGQPVTADLLNQIIAYYRSLT